MNMAKSDKNESWFDRITRKIGNLLSRNEQEPEGVKVESEEAIEEASKVEKPKVKKVKEKEVQKGKEPKTEVKKEPKARSKKATNESQKAEAKAETKPTAKPVEDKQSLAKLIVSLLTELIDESAMTIGKTLVLWMDSDQLTYDSYSTEAYRTQILGALANECGFNFEKLECKNGIPDKGIKATPIGKSGKVFLQIVAKQEEAPKAVCCKAKISIFGGKGSLLQEQYILSSEDIKDKKVYNIGAGQFPKECGYRENYIAIDDNPESPQVELNKYVSRTHAHIGFSDKFGFYLQVELEGSRLRGKRTRIIRGQNFIECENPQAIEPLQTGDLIELGKAVVLRYEQIQED